MDPRPKTIATPENKPRIPQLYATSQAASTLGKPPPNPQHSQPHCLTHILVTLAPHRRPSLVRQIYNLTNATQIGTTPQPNKPCSPTARRRQSRVSPRGRRGDLCNTKPSMYHMYSASRKRGVRAGNFPQNCSWKQGCIKAYSEVCARRV